MILCIKNRDGPKEQYLPYTLNFWFNLATDIPALVTVGPTPASTSSSCTCSLEAKTSSTCHPFPSSWRPSFVQTTSNTSKTLNIRWAAKENHPGTKSYLLLAFQFLKNLLVYCRTYYCRTYCRTYCHTYCRTILSYLLLQVVPTTCLSILKKSFSIYIFRMSNPTMPLFHL